MPLFDLNGRANINVYSPKCLKGKNVVIYDDHRTILNVLFSIRKEEHIIPDIVTFDYHEDCIPLRDETKIEKYQNIECVDIKEFWSFVEWDLSILDDDWITVAQKLKLANNIVVIGAKREGLENINNERKEPFLYSIGHLADEFAPRGSFEDIFYSNNEMRDDIVAFFGYEGNIHKTGDYILDIDLDCFSTSLECGGRIAWPETVFREKYYDDSKVYSAMSDLIRGAKCITICREPECCGGIGESMKILSYIDKYFLKGNLGTMAKL